MLLCINMEEKNSLNDLRSPGLLGKKPMIGLMMFVIGSFIFIILAYNLVHHGPLMKWDLPLAQSFHVLALNSPQFVTNIMITGFYIGKWGIVVVAVLLALYFLYKKFWCELSMTVASLGLSGLVFLLLSNIFKRPRPFLLFDKMVWPGSPNIPGFPSGHTLSIIVLSVFFVYFLAPKAKSYLGKVLIVLIALLVVIFIGFSRLYLGDHYLTDIIAGYAVGIAWFGLTCTFVELLFERYKKVE
jgi:undecaprenyl-diphosphatase